MKMLNHKWKVIGWIIFIPSFVLGILYLSSFFDHKDLLFPVFAVMADEDMFTKNQEYFAIIKRDVINELIGLSFLFGCLMIAFSKEKIEDEFIKSTRLQSWMQAILANSFILAFALLFIYDGKFFSFMSIQMYLPLVLFIGIFHLKLSRLKKESHEE